jgi:hypothetical protein
VIGYRLLPPAEEEMTEAALFYEAANAGLGDDFLDDIQHAIDTIRERPRAWRKGGVRLSSHAGSPLPI